MKNLITGARLLGLLLVASTQLGAFAPNNFFKPYDYNLRLNEAGKKQHAFRLGANVEYGSRLTGKDWDSKTRNVLALYEETQAFIPSLMGPVNTAAVGVLAGLGAPFGGAPVDDGVRGHVALNGRFEMLDVTLQGRYALPFRPVPGCLGLNVQLPIRDARVSVRQAADQTVVNFPVDAAINALLADRATIQTSMKTYGGLDWSDWSKTDVGDLVVMLDWYNNYSQKKDGLENVQLLAKLGLSIPTAAERDEDKAFSVALGNDGAWSVPFGLGLNLDFKYNIRLGAEAEFEVLFDHTKNYRMKTEEHQTRFMLLNKGRASMDYGFSWKFNLMLQAYRFWQGCSLGVSYQYFKHDDDRLTPQSNDFDANIANSAQWLKEYNMHHFIFRANWDGGCCKRTGWTPQLSFFYKLPIDGKNAMLPQTFGGQLAINF